MRKVIYTIALTALFLMQFISAGVCADAVQSEFNRRLSTEERASICAAIRNNQQEIPEDKDPFSGKGIVPRDVLESIYQTTYNISNATADVLVMGQALTCHATYAAKSRIEVFGLTLVSYPNIPVWLCGGIIYLLGFFMTLSVAFYLIDISFKLGFAVIALPVGIALWPFAWTKDKLVTIISIILKSAAIFAFLALIITFALELLSSAVDGTEELFNLIDNNQTEKVAEKFSLTSTTFMLCLFALVYGIKLIGSAIPDYVDQFFPDGVFGSASPMHHSTTQAMDFVKQKAVAPVASYAADVAKTQAGNVVKGGGKLITGGYNQQLRTAAQYIRHPERIAAKGMQFGGKVGASVFSGTTKGAVSIVSGTVGRIFLNKKARAALQAKINQSIDNGATAFKNGANKRATRLYNGVATSRTSLGGITGFAIKAPAYAVTDAVGLAAKAANWTVMNTIGRFIPKNKRQVLHAQINQRIDNVTHAVDSRVGSFANGLERRINNVTSKIGNTAAKIGNATAKTGRAITQNRVVRGLSRRTQKVSKPIGRFATSVAKLTKNLYNDAVADVKDSLDSLETGKNRILNKINSLTQQALQTPKAYISAVSSTEKKVLSAIDNFAQKLRKKSDGATRNISNTSKNASQRLTNLRDKYINRVNRLIEKRTTDSFLTSVTKSTGRSILKTPVRLLHFTTQTVSKTAFSIAQIPSRLGSGAIQALNLAAQAPVRVVSGLLKMPAHAERLAFNTLNIVAQGVVRTGSAFIKTPARVERLALQVINPKNWVRAAGGIIRGTIQGTGNVMIHVGDQMGRNKKSDKQLKAEARAKAEEEERKRRQRRADGLDDD